MNTTTQSTNRAHQGMLIWALIVGLSFPAVALLSEGLPPLALTAIRFSVAALVIGPLVWGRAGFWPSPRSLVLYLLLGLCIAAFFAVMFWVAHRMTALSMATLYVSVPLLAYFIGRTIGVEERARGLLVILLLGAIGALALAWAGANGQLKGMDFDVGEAAYFFGCFASALYPVLSKWGLKRELLSPRADIRTFWSLVSGGVLVAALALLWEDVQLVTIMSLTDVALVLYLGVFSSGLTFWLTQRATVDLSPGAITAYSYLVPFISMLLLFIDEPQSIGWRWFPGSALVLFAITTLLRGNAKTWITMSPAVATVRRTWHQVKTLKWQSATCLSQAANTYSGTSRCASLTTELPGEDYYENRSFGSSRKRGESRSYRGVVTWTQSDCGHSRPHEIRQIAVQCEATCCRRR